jgi:hypothetical protein
VNFVRPERASSHPDKKLEEILDHVVLFTTSLRIFICRYKGRPMVSTPLSVVIFVDLVMILTMKPRDHFV